jgi:acetolactate synthase-1/2/3 large subunit
MALGASDTRHPLALHMLGMHGLASANYAVEDCDFLIAVGARFDDRVAGDPGRFAPNARKIAHFDVDSAEIGKVKRVDWHHVGLSTGISRSCWSTDGASVSPRISAPGMKRSPI